MYKAKKLKSVRLEKALSGSVKRKCCYLGKFRMRVKS